MCSSRMSTATGGSRACRLYRERALGGYIGIGRYRPIGGEGRGRAAEEAGCDAQISQASDHGPARGQFHGLVPLPENRYFTRAAIARMRTMTARSERRPMPHIIAPPII